MNIGFLGTGHITHAIILGIFKSNLKIKKIYIPPRNKFIAKKLIKRFKKVTIAKDNQQLINKSNWVFLAITPQVGKKILNKLNFKQVQKIISFISTSRALRRSHRGAGRRNLPDGFCRIRSARLAAAQRY